MKAAGNAVAIFLGKCLLGARILQRNCSAVHFSPFFFPSLRHIRNAFFPLLKSEDIRSVTVRGFPVSIIFTGNSRELARFL